MAWEQDFQWRIHNFVNKAADRMPSESKLSSLCVLAIYYIKYIILNNASITEPIGLSKLLLLLDGVILHCILYYIHFCYLGTAKALYLLA